MRHALRYRIRLQLWQECLRGLWRSGNFQIIYSANTSVIGKNPDQINVGNVLKTSCLDTAEEAFIGDVSAIAATETAEQLPAPKDDLTRIVVGGDWALFTGETLEQGGMITEITNISMAQSSSKPEYRSDFIKEWGAHFNLLISDHMYDLSIVWFRPNCDVLELLSEVSRLRCNNLDWSETLFEHVFINYAHVDAPKITAYHELQGKSVCRHEGYSIFMMEEEGLYEPVPRCIPRSVLERLSEWRF